MYEISIERGKVREFARATHSTDPIYLEERAIIPPTFLTTAMCEAPADAVGLDDIGFDLSRVLHGEEECVFYGDPPRAGETLQVNGYIADRSEKVGARGGTMRMATLVNEFVDGRGNLVARQRTTFIETAPVERRP